ncbi:MAG TPA: hypothetical protein VLB72_05950 [Burkholderiales bacterium]|nr:hypothetical protein [Burkholderiales bacterium]
MRRWIWTLALATAWIAASPSHAQMPRQLPANGKLGELVGGQHPLPLLQINKQVVRLAPGGRIYDQHNRTIPHSHLPQHAAVLFVQDMNGDISRVYILRPEELVQLQQTP